MFTVDEFFSFAMQQRYGITGLHVTTMAKHYVTYLDERFRRRTDCKPILRFNFRGHDVQAVMPMVIKQEWFTGTSGVAMPRIFAECAWGAAEVEACIKKLVEDMKDNLLCKGEM